MRLRVHSHFPPQNAEKITKMQKKRESTHRDILIQSLTHSLTPHTQSHKPTDFFEINKRSSISYPFSGGTTHPAALDSATRPHEAKWQPAPCSSGDPSWPGCPPDRTTSPWQQWPSAGDGGGRERAAQRPVATAAGRPLASQGREGVPALLGMAPALHGTRMHYIGSQRYAAYFLVFKCSTILFVRQLPQ